MAAVGTAIFCCAFYFAYCILSKYREDKKAIETKAIAEGMAYGEINKLSGQHGELIFNFHSIDEGAVVAKTVDDRKVAPKKKLGSLDEQEM